MIRIIFYCVLPVFFLANDAAWAKTIVGRVVGVSDGDTLTLLDGQNRRHRIRLAEIDAPESRQAFGQRSKQSLSELAYRKEAVAECPSTDRYGRAVCTVTVAGAGINLAQVQRGMAWVYPRFARDPRLFEAQRTAQAERRGLWVDASPTPPWEFRKGAAQSPASPGAGCCPRP
jgi:endonuclease YncB( thermonuclease family)